MYRDSKNNLENEESTLQPSYDYSNNYDGYTEQPEDFQGNNKNIPDKESSQSGTTYRWLDDYGWL